ncbi:ABC transporter permease [Salinicoccus sp. ID82-1]|uniref:ABC transporter permease n=1 Tax=Salinicoccus sp. ID82-1 TaxID=2820269 RepID=UPI001F2D245B|nr:ABC transporter permease [Salinicoccus sp. ID82-1]MCG1008955.1 ABC transporter permease [Salinicoccus sp. ID82-1]
MGNIFSLVRNELGKIYVMKSTWAMYVFLVALVLFSFIMNTVTDSVDSETTYTDDWRTELQEENQTLTEEIETAGEDDPFVESTNMGIIQQNTYMLENDIRPYGYHAGNFVLDNLFTTSLVSLFVIIIAGGIVANEFRWGTIKQLLIRPISRGTILLSKYIALLLFTLFTVVFLLATSAIVGAIVYGAPVVNPEIIVNRPDGMASNALLPEIFMQYGFRVLNIIVLATFGFMISSIFRSSALAIGLSMFLMFIGTTVAQAMARYECSKYILFANTDLSVYFSSYGPIREEMTIGFSVAVIAVYMVVFIITAWTIFIKRDVA